MLICEGYKMFFGVCQINWASGTPERVRGTWLFKPEYDCWYCNGRSYPGVIVEVVEDLT